MSDAPKAVRIDRWLFAVRVFKTRGLAAKAIASGRIKVNGQTVKAHRLIRIGEKITYRAEGRTLEYQVTGLLERRVGAKEAVKNYVLVEDPDLDPKMREVMQAYREASRGQSKTRGRPTKRDRRKLEQLKGE